MAAQDDDEFGLGSSDDEAFEEVAVAVESPKMKRKHESTTQHEPRKRIVLEEQNGLKYPLTSSVAITALTHFKIPAFRLKQEAVIARILNGGSAVVVFPTGGGKSLCYQVPAITFGATDSRDPAEGGITLVVSPLIALMKDQVDALRRKGIMAAVLDSTKTREEYLDTVDAMRKGSLRLLYCAPERLNNEGFVEQMKEVRGGIRLVAVDEAHCISEWGHAFRPDYLKVARFVKEIKAERVVCLTATATPQVAKDICDAFNIDDTGLFRTSSYRSNLQLLAESGPTKMSLYPRLFTFLRANPGPTIIYVTLQKQTEALADDLRSKGFNAKAFHAGMQTTDKMKLQDEFMASNKMVIVATIAFGMGIDKSDIRNVVHFNIPSSLESYSQEIGRAGRDGKISKCLFYLCGEDLHLREIFARGDLPSRDSVHRLLRDLFEPENASLKIGQTLQVSQYDQSKTYDIRLTTLSNIYAQLELRFGLFRAITPIYTKYSWTQGHASGVMAGDNSPAAKAIKVSAQKAKTITNVDITAAATSNKISRADLVRKLNEWNDAQAIQLRTAGVLNVFRVTATLPDNDNKIKELASSLYAQLESREQKDLHRTDEMLALITGSTCFSRSLAQHFGDSLPDNAENCGHCTWCLTQKPVELISPPPKEFSQTAFKAVLDAVPARDDPLFLARVAFGISSPRVTAMKIGSNPVFGSMGDCEFMELVKRFKTVCDEVGDGVVPSKTLQKTSSTAKEKNSKSNAKWGK